MSEKAEKKKDDKPAEGGDHAAGAKKKGGGIGALLTKLPVLLGGAMAVEAVVMLIGFKLLSGGPKAADAAIKLDEPAAEKAQADKPAAEAKEETKAETGEKSEKPAAEGGEAAASTDPKRPVELMVVDFRTPNKIGGRTFLYDVSIYAVTKGKNKSIIEAAIKDRGALIKDRIRTIIAQLDPDKLGGGAEPGLETLRRQVKYQLDEIVGPGLVDEVLVPRCTPFRTDF